MSYDSCVVCGVSCVVRRELYVVRRASYVVRRASCVASCVVCRELCVVHCPPCVVWCGAWLLVMSVSVGRGGQSDGERGDGCGEEASGGRSLIRSSAGGADACRRVPGAPTYAGANGGRRPAVAGEVVGRSAGVGQYGAMSCLVRGLGQRLPGAAAAGLRRRDPSIPGPARQRAQSAVGQGQPSWRNMPRRSLTARISEILPSVTVNHQICSTSKERLVGSGMRG